MVSLKKSLRNLLIISAMIIFSLISVVYVYGDPTGPSTATASDPQRLNASAYGAKQIAASAGNVTKLTITGVSVTQAWQGFYGNVTGTITLDDASNYTFYDWAIAEPQGEIYAANQTVSDWSTAHCFNYTNNGTYHNYTYDGGLRNTTSLIVLNLTEIERNFNMSFDDADGVDETFNETGDVLGGDPHQGFFVGAVEVLNGTCPSTNTYVNDARNTNGSFQSVMLTVNNSDTIIFATLIEDRTIGSGQDFFGFNNATHDFQIMVLDNGHNGDEAATTWFFYVELE